jgi:DNA-binding response OmpR family regulator
VKQKILLADDSFVNREYLKEILLEKNFETLEAGTGAEALDIIETTSPDLMMLDLTMPDIGGLDTLKRVRAKGYTFPILIFTSDYKDDTKNKCLKAGANEVLHKPCKPYHLVDVITKLLAGHSKGISQI